MGKKRIIAETGAGQHGVAVATVCRAIRPALRSLSWARPTSSARSRMSFACSCWAPRCGPVTPARHAEGRDERGPARLGHQCRGHLSTLIGTAAGPHPYPDDGARFPVGDRHRRCASRCRTAEGRLPDTLVAAIGGGSNAIGLFHPFLDDKVVSIDRRRSRRAAASTCRTGTAPR